MSNLKIREYESNYVTGVAELDYVYPTEIYYSLMNDDDRRRYKDFTIEYYNKYGKDNKDPLAAYASNFGLQDGVFNCATCGTRHCPGHFGLVEFPSDGKDQVMIYHPQYVNIIKDILGVVCQTCWKLLPLPDIPKKGKQEPVEPPELAKIRQAPAPNRLAMLKKLVGTSKFNECNKTEETAKGKKLVCGTKYKIKNLGAFRGKISVEEAPAHQARKKKIKESKREGCEDSDTEVSDQDNVHVIDLQTRKVYDGFMMIGGKSGETRDMEYLGFTKKQLSGMFMCNMLVIPTRFRPRTIKSKNDKLTVAISAIISICTGYDFCNNSHYKSLVLKISEYMDLITSKFGGKKGLWRSKVFGKRPEEGARAVIVPSDYADLGQLEVSSLVAERGRLSTAPILVTEDNIEAMQELLLLGNVSSINKVRGRDAWRDMVIAADNFADRSFHILEVGDKIKPKLKDGDVVVMGRQPTANQQNISAATVLLVPTNTFGLNLLYTRPFGGDYDGDTIYIQVLQTPEAIEEAREQMGLERNIRTAQAPKPIFGLTYNSIVASSMLTLPGVKVNDGIYYQCLYDYYLADRLKTLPARLAKYDIHPRSGHALFSTTLPEDFHYEGGKKGFEIIIKEGVLISGILSDSTVGSGSGGIIDRMSLFYGPKSWKITATFISDSTRMMSTFIDAFGFSVAYKDCLFMQGGELSALLESKLEAAKLEILKMKQPETPFEHIQYEKRIQGILNGLKSTATEVFAQINKQENNLIFMSEFVSGAKGKEGNLANIGISLGPQMLMGQRLPRSVTGNQRRIITERPGSLFPEARGYIKNSYVYGMSPNESQGLATAGREGNVQTATTTPELGQMQRYLQLGLGDIVTKQGSVVMPNNVVLDFCYGSDSMDGLSLMGVNGTYQFCDIKTMVNIINDTSS